MCAKLAAWPSGHSLFQIGLFKVRTGRQAFPSAPSVLSPEGHGQLVRICSHQVGLVDTSPLGFQSQKLRETLDVGFKTFALRRKREFCLSHCARGGIMVKGSALPVWMWVLLTGPECQSCSASFWVSLTGSCSGCSCMFVHRSRWARVPPLSPSRTGIPSYIFFDAWYSQVWCLLSSLNVHDSFMYFLYFHSFTRQIIIHNIVDLFFLLSGRAEKQ